MFIRLVLPIFALFLTKTAKGDEPPEIPMECYPLMSIMSTFNEQTLTNDTVLEGFCSEPEGCRTLLIEMFQIPLPHDMCRKIDGQLCWPGYLRNASLIQQIMNSSQANDNNSPNFGNPDLGKAIPMFCSPCSIAISQANNFTDQFPIDQNTLCARDHDGKLCYENTQHVQNIFSRLSRNTIDEIEQLLPSICSCAIDAPLINATMCLKAGDTYCLRTSLGGFQWVLQGVENMRKNPAYCTPCMEKIQSNIGQSDFYNAMCNPIIPTVAPKEVTSSAKSITFTGFLLLVQALLIMQ